MKFIAWLKGEAHKNIADLHFEISNKKDEHYSRLLLLKELRIDLLQINDMINYHILKTKLIRRGDSKADKYFVTKSYVEESFWFSQRIKYYNEQRIAKLTLLDKDKKSKFFFRVNGFHDSSHKGLSLDVSFYPKDKDAHYEFEKNSIDIYEFDELFSNWVNNINLFNDFKIDEYDSSKLLGSEMFSSSQNKPEEKLSDLEVSKMVIYLDELKLLIQAKKTSKNSRYVSKLVSEIDYIKSNLTHFSKKKLKFYLSLLGKKIIWFVKEITWELIKEVIARNLLGPG